MIGSEEQNHFLVRTEFMKGNENRVTRTKKRY